MGAVTTAVDLVARLQSRGFELVADPPNLRVRHPSRSEAEKARPLLEELREHKREALEVLTGHADEDERGPAWDNDWERARLEAVGKWCDEERRRTDDWVAAWDWVAATRPDLRQAIDDALDGISTARRSEDTGGHIRACAALQLAVQDAADAYLEQ